MKRKLCKVQVAQIIMLIAWQIFATITIPTVPEALHSYWYIVFHNLVSILFCISIWRTNNEISKLEDKK